ncbi:hypothetical protein E2562_012244 [Oryza meyeriana var. granulata]|uniref:Uncharacterized protein n=1 Tax=Oryza meyeriana var. granulata TaxID=110450 RepID=A0A6G1D2N9_9ORYZ|nr:hypothetical protein E2562_012244 [Oryza meyeriana var. granulata]
MATTRSSRASTAKGRRGEGRCPWASHGEGSITRGRHRAGRPFSAAAAVRSASSLPAPTPLLDGVTIERDSLLHMVAACGRWLGAPSLHEADLPQGPSRCAQRLGRHAPALHRQHQECRDDLLPHQPRGRRGRDVGEQLGYMSMFSI